MTNLIVEHPHDPAGPTTGAALTIGRGDDNDVVLDHPTVSRHHAIIERRGGNYSIRDLSSRNGTRVNGRSVRGNDRRALAHGDKLRIGRVRLTFAVGADATAPPSLDHGDGAPPQTGIVFNCACGVRLWAKEQAAGDTLTCRMCQAKVVVPAESTNTHSGETISGLAFTPPEALGAPVQTGTCSICQWQTSTEDRITACPSCGLTFHAECWVENHGCAAYGCAHVNALASAAGAPAEKVHASEVHAAGILSVPDVNAADPAFPVGRAMLVASVVGGALGLLAFGALSAIALATSVVLLAKREHARHRAMLLAAAIAGLVGAIGGVIVSSLWWFSGVSR